jgi:DNA-binding transcriptional ArsR family regulator
MKYTRAGYRDIERIMKGVANHFRVEILVFLDNFPDKSLCEISEALKSDFRNISEHTRKMAQAGLVHKRHDGVTVHHRLTSLGKCVLSFLKTIGNG